MNRRALLALTFAATSAAATGLIPAAARADIPGTEPISAEAYRQGMLIGGSYNRQTSQTALTLSAAPKLRQFAQFDLAEQVAIAQVLLGSNDPAPMLAPLDSQHTAALNSLRGRTGRDFDLTYVQSQIIGHRELLQLCDNYLRSMSADPSLHPVAILSRPTLQSHLALLAELQTAIQQG